jgi:hypothetical protein
MPVREFAPKEGFSAFLGLREFRAKRASGAQNCPLKIFDQKQIFVADITSVT